MPITHAHPLLVELGWDDRLATLLEAEAPGLKPGRVLSEDRGQHAIAVEAGDIRARVSGRLRHAAELDPTTPWPAVGDWVATTPAPHTSHWLIERVLPRRTAVVRRTPGDRRLPSQTLAANVDTVFVVTSANADFNERRLERYLAVAWDSGARPVILLSKSDLVDDPTPFLAAAMALAPTADVVAVSVVTGDGLEAVRGHLGPGRTVVFIGSSGVGKSSIVNALTGAAVHATAAIREDDARGRHTTTRRQLIRLGAGLLIDTPGLRELGVMDGAGVDAAFEEIERAAAGCRFSDCRHDGEPGCAVQAEIATGALDPVRLEAWRRLRREAQRAARATDAVARRAEQARRSRLQRAYEAQVRRTYGSD